MTRVCITGATGFIGGRLAEICVRRNIPTVALVRNWSRASRLARMALTMAPGNVMDAASLAPAMDGCDVVFHCAVDNRAHGALHRNTSARGTENVMRAAAAAGVRRVVHLSSTAVFSYRPGPEAAVETAPTRRTGDAYCDGKIDGEQIALRHHGSGTSVVVLRPTIVYGPFGDYSRDIVGLIRQGRMVLVNGGAGVCNTLFVDNLVDAMLLAATSEEAAGGIFHVSDAAPVTWKAFIEAHARAVGADADFPSMTDRELAEARRRGKRSSAAAVARLAHDPVLRRSLREVPVVDTVVGLAETTAAAVLPAALRERTKAVLFGPPHDPLRAPVAADAVGPEPLSQPEAFMVSAFDGVTFSIERARRVLGYAPGIAFDEGMRRTAAWLKWARL
jgi:nucleoside-diphosphate-sugar epimerase